MELMLKKALYKKHHKKFVYSETSLEKPDISGRRSLHFIVIQPVAKDHLSSLRDHIFKPRGQSSRWVALYTEWLWQFFAQNCQQYSEACLDIRHCICNFKMKGQEKENTMGSFDTYIPVFSDILRQLIDFFICTHIMHIKQLCWRKWVTLAHWHFPDVSSKMLAENLST